MKREIIVIGVTHHNTLSMVRCVGHDYTSVELLLYGSGRISHIAHSNCVNKTIFLETANDCLDFLMQRPAGKEKAVIISCTDQIAQILDSHQEELQHKYEFFHTRRPGNLTRYMDKQVQVDLAASIDLAVPVSYVYKKGSNLKYNGPFPCIVKPVESYVGGKQITVCQNIKDVQGAVGSAAIDWQIQELIRKQSEIVLAGVSLNTDVIIPGYVYKHRELKGGTTYATVHPLDEGMAPLIKKAKEMVRKIGYEGLFGFEFIFDGQGYYFLELNLRNDATCYAYKEAGVNLPLLYLMDKEHKDISPLIREIQRVDSMVEPNDFSFVRAGKMSLWEWLKQLRHAKCKYLYDRKDLRPLLYYIIYALKRKM